MTKSFALYPTPLGSVLIAHKGERLTLLQILKTQQQNEGVHTPFTDTIYHQILEYIGGTRHTFEVEIDLSHCTPFQQRVYNVLRQIPYGETQSYKEVATAIGQPSASRAVGMANHRNPIHLIVPCHRVVASSGLLTGYAAGIEVKAALLEIEQQHSGLIAL